MTMYWDRFLEEGKESFAYMIQNFDSMFSENHTKHFDIRPGMPNMQVYYVDVANTVQNDIIPVLFSWIKLEFESERLVQYEKWKPVRDAYSINDMFLGYNKLFVYKEYCFQLAIESGCGSTCGDHTCDYFTHFELAYYGLTKDMSLSSDNSIPDKYWKIK
jgi:hypothetical protein